LLESIIIGRKNKYMNSISFPIKTERLSITKFDESMVDSFQANSMDDDIRRFVPDEVFETLDEARATLAKLISYYNQDNAPLVYPILLHDGQNIGYVQAVPYYDEWEIGYHVAKAHTGKRYASEALRAFLPFIIRQLGIGHIIGISHIDNIASRRVMEKSGFDLEYDGPGPYQGEELHIRRYVYHRVE